MSLNIKKVSPLGLLVALGIIFGDIGTSPLYVFKAIIDTRVITEQLVLGGISCVFWTLTIQTTFKYILLTLHADHRGEGGIFSLYALVRRFGKWIYIPTILGAATLLADGIIAVSLFVIPAVLLPFHDDFSIDEQSFRAHLRDVTAVQGLSAITINAHSTEVASCTRDEQRRVMEIASNEVGDTLPIIHGVWKTHEEAKEESGGVHGNSVMFFSMPDHGGTHIDAPRHFGQDATPIDKYPLEYCIVPGICIDRPPTKPRPGSAQPPARPPAGRRLEARWLGARGGAEM